MKSGFVAIVGRPNVGKSTLINNILDTKVAIISDKPGTTRHSIHGVYNEEDVQIVFVDTPGIHKPKHKLGETLNKSAYHSLNDVDAALFLVDATDDEMGRGDSRILDVLISKKIPIVLVLNKIDKMKKSEILEKIDYYSKIYEFAEIVPISGLKKENVDSLISALKKYLSDEILYYPKEQVTNRSKEFMIGEIVREKVFLLTEEEIPHSVTCVVESIESKKNAKVITVLIIVDRESLKKIIIGKQGSMVKKIGIMAREEIEVLLGEKVYLELFVKVIKKWREKERQINELGYGE